MPPPACGTQTSLTGAEGLGVGDAIQWRAGETETDDKPKAKFAKAPPREREEWGPYHRAKSADIATLLPEDEH